MNNLVGKAPTPTPRKKLEESDDPTTLKQRKDEVWAGIEYVKQWNYVVKQKPKRCLTKKLRGQSHFE